jgi:hypothetical protein
VRARSADVEVQKGATQVVGHAADQRLARIQVGAEEAVDAEVDDRERDEHDSGEEQPADEEDEQTAIVAVASLTSMRRDAL